MKNSDYWKRRFLILEDATTKRGQKYLYTLDREFKTSSRRIEKEIAVWYQRFANNNGISLAEAKKWLTAGELKELKWTLEEYIKYGKENALNGQWVKQLENASAKVHISRLEALKIEVQQNIEVLYGNQLDGIDNLVRKIYTDSYYHTAFEIQKGFNVGWDLTPINTRQLERATSTPWTLDRQTFSDRVWKQKDALIAKVQTELTQSLLRGDSPDNAIKAISAQFNVSKHQAGRLVMTESAYFASAAQKDCFNELDVERFEIVATLDSHTSQICQGLDGHVEDMKNYEAGVTAPPFHPWCRSVSVPYFDDDYGERAARGADGKTYYVPSNMKYEDWKSSFVDKTKDGELIPINTEKRGHTGFDGQDTQFHKWDGSENDPIKMIMDDTGVDEERAGEVYDAISRYSGDDYDVIRKRSNDEYSRMADTIDEYIMRAPKYDDEIYRGISLTPEKCEKLLTELTNGGIIDMQGVSSWSSEMDAAKRFAGLTESTLSGEPIIFGLAETNIGTSIQHLSHHGTREAEVLLSSTGKFKLAGDIQHIIPTRLEQVVIKGEKRMIQEYYNFISDMESKYGKSIWSHLTDDEWDMVGKLEVVDKAKSTADTIVVKEVKTGERGYYLVMLKEVFL